MRGLSGCSSGFSNASRFGLLLRARCLHGYQGDHGCTILQYPKEAVQWGQLFQRHCAFNDCELVQVLLCLCGSICTPLRTGHPAKTGRIGGKSPRSYIRQRRAHIDYQQYNSNSLSAGSHQLVYLIARPRKRSCWYMIPTNLTKVSCIVIQKSHASRSWLLCPTWPRRTNPLRLVTSQVRYGDVEGCSTISPSASVPLSSSSKVSTSSTALSLPAPWPCKAESQSATCTTAFPCTWPIASLQFLQSASSRIKNAISILGSMSLIWSLRSLLVWHDSTSSAVYWARLPCSGKAGRVWWGSR